MKRSFVLLLLAFSAAASAGDVQQEKKDIAAKLAELGKAQKYVEMVPFRERLVTLAATDLERANAEESLAALHQHTLGNLAEGKKHYLEAIRLYNSVAEGKDAAGKIPLLEKNAGISKASLRDKNETKRYCLEIVTLSRELMKTASEKDRLACLNRIQGCYRNAEMKAEADATVSEIVACWKDRFETNKGLPNAEWLKQTAPEAAIRQLAPLEAGYDLAHDVADRVLAMPEAEKALKVTAAQVMYDASQGSPSLHPAERCRYVKAVAELTGAANWNVTYGEVMFRYQHQLEAARAVFKSVQDNPAYSDNDRTTARQWLDMLADE